MKTAASLAYMEFTEFSTELFPVKNANQQTWLLSTSCLMVTNRGLAEEMRLAALSVNSHLVNKKSHPNGASGIMTQPLT